MLQCLCIEYQRVTLGRALIYLPCRTSGSRHVKELAQGNADEYMKIILNAFLKGNSSRTLEGLFRSNWINQVNKMLHGRLEKPRDSNDVGST